MGRGRGQSINTKQVYIDPRQAFQGRTKDAREIFIKRLSDLIGAGKNNRDWDALSGLLASNMNSLKGKQVDMKEPFFQEIYQAAVEDLLNSGINEENFLDSRWNKIFQKEFVKTIGALKQGGNDNFNMEIEFNKPIIYSTSFKYEGNESKWGDKDKFYVVDWGARNRYINEIFKQPDFANKFYTQMIPMITQLKKDGKLSDEQAESKYSDLSSKLAGELKERDYEYDGTVLMSVTQTVDLADRLWRSAGVKTAEFSKRNPTKYYKGNDYVWNIYKNKMNQEVTSKNIEELTPEKVEENISKVSKALVSHQIHSLMNKDISSKKTHSQTRLMNDALNNTTKAAYLKRLAPMFGDDKKDLYKCIKENEDLIRQMEPKQIIEIIQVAGGALWDENKSSQATPDSRSQQPKSAYQRLCYIEPTSGTKTQASILYAIENIEQNTV